jgi:hypothetical protein
MSEEPMDPRGSSSGGPEMRGRRTDGEEEEEFESMDDFEEDEEFKDGDADDEDDADEDADEDYDEGYDDFDEEYDEEGGEPRRGGGSRPPRREGWE